MARLGTVLGVCTLLAIAIVAVLCARYLADLSRAESRYAQISTVFSPDLRGIQKAAAEGYIGELETLRGTHIRRDLVDVLIGDINRVVSRQEKWVSQRRVWLRRATGWYESAVAQSPNDIRNLVKFAETRAEIGEEPRLVMPLVEHATGLAPWDWAMNARIGFLCTLYWQVAEDSFRQTCSHTLANMHADGRSKQHFEHLSRDLPAFGEVHEFMGWDSG